MIGMAGLSLKQSKFASVVFIGFSPARSDIPIIYHKNQLGVVVVNDWFISQLTIQTDLMVFYWTITYKT